MTVIRSRPEPFPPSAVDVARALIEKEGVSPEMVELSKWYLELRAKLDQAEDGELTLPALRTK